MPTPPRALRYCTAVAIAALCVSATTMLAGTRGAVHLAIMTSGASLALGTLLAVVIAGLALGWALLLCREVRRRKQMESDLLRQLGFQQALMDNMPVPLFMRTADGVMLSCNQAYLDWHDTTADEVIGTDLQWLSRFVSPAIVEEALYRPVIQEKRSTVSEVTTVINGKPRPAYVWAAPFAGPQGELHGVVGGLLDIGERILLENDLRHARDAAEAARIEAVRANQAKSRFLSNVSHDMRTPLNVIIGMLDLELSGANSTLEERQNTLETAQESARQLLGLIDDMLDLAKIEAAGLTLSPTPVHLGELLGRVERVFGATARHKGLVLQTDFQGVDVWISLDGLRLWQVLGNLLSNAIKFTARGYVRLSVEVRPRGDDFFATFCVADSGIGIAPEEQATIFEPFTQASHSAHGQFGGTGLGLAICKQLSILMGGDIRLDSDPGIGTQVWVGLPLKHSAPAESGRPNETDRMPQSGLRVLIVDDHPSNRRIMRTQFEQLGCSVAEADNGLAALERWHQERFDVLVTDWSMPRMGGAELMTAVRRAEAGHDRHTTLLCLTAHVEREIAAEAMRCGADLSLVKPVTRDQWRAVLAQLHPAHPTAAAPLHAELRLDAELVASILHHHAQDLIAAQNDFAHGDYAALAERAHHMKGPLQFTHCRNAVELCEELEAFCDEQADPDVIGDGLQRLIDATDEIRRTLSDGTGSSPGWPATTPFA
ncbi:ATP-binding protein [Uliginosibacterium sp. sgz301328]|uniref:ATP-binding protein n=1 Tax=Uliginosibacterium sp. sgz301328 TaxID=3243764 RepID=UPI00359D9A24